MRFSRLLSSVAVLAFVRAASADAIISVQPSVTNSSLGSIIDLNVNISGVTDLYAYQFDLGFDPTILSALSVANGLFVSTIADGTFISGTIDNVGGTISATADSKIGLVPGVTGSGKLADVQFLALSAGATPLTISNVILLDSNLNDILLSTTEGRVDVSGPSGVPEPSSVVLFGTGLIAVGWSARRLKRPILGSRFKL